MELLKKLLGKLPSGSTNVGLVADGGIALSLTKVVSKRDQDYISDRFAKAVVSSNVNITKDLLKAYSTLSDTNKIDPASTVVLITSQTPSALDMDTLKRLKESNLRVITVPVGENVDMSKLKDEDTIVAPTMSDGKDPDQIAVNILEKSKGIIQRFIQNPVVVSLFCPALEIKCQLERVFVS